MNHLFDMNDLSHFREKENEIDSLILTLNLFSNNSAYLEGMPRLSGRKSVHGGTRADNVR